MLRAGLHRGREGDRSRVLAPDPGTRLGRLGNLLVEDFTVEWPNAGLRIRGRSNFVGFNRTYPEGWSIEVLRIVGDGNTAVSEVRVPHPEVGPYYVVSFLETEADQAKRGREYWVEERDEEPHPDRARWFEGM